MIRPLAPWMLFLLHGGLLLFAGCAAPAETGTLALKDAWTRPYRAGASPTTAIYLAIENNTEAPTTLTGVSLVQADTVELHQTIRTGGVMRMRAVDTVRLPAGAAVHFKPGGNHIMVKGLRLTLAEGDSLPFVLHFGDGTSRRTTARVRWE